MSGAFEVRSARGRPRHYDCLIVGAGHGGSQVAISLRQNGYSGTIGLLGDEAGLPYERPPLSKDYLVGTKSIDAILLRPEQHWAQRGIDVIPGKCVIGLDARDRLVACRDGSEFTYGRAVWAAGGRARRVTCAGHDAAGVHTIRSRADVDAIRNELQSVETVGIIGAGFVGLESAASFRSLGKSVVVLESLNRALARVCGEPVSRFYEGEHRRHGVDVRLSAHVDGIETSSGRVSHIRLSDHSRIPVQMAVVGIGIEPAVGPLLAAGAAGQNGVSVDENCSTSLQDVYAVGDCAIHRNAFAGGRAIRLESVQNAMEQAITVAKHIVGVSWPYRSLPWFWSKQYDLLMQTAGLAMDFDDMVWRGDKDSQRFSVVYLRGERIQAVDCINSPADFLQARQVIHTGTSIDVSRLADRTAPLKSLAKQ